MSPESGQSTVEYVAIVAIVAIVLAATVAGGAIFAPGIANAVVGKVRHALCVVAGRACVEVAERPCVIRSARDERRETLSVAVVHVGTGRVVLRERLSDGTLRLTVLHQGGLGLTAGAGTTTRVKVGGADVDVGAHAQGTIAGLVGRGEVFEVRTAAEANAIVRRLRASGSSTVDIGRRVLLGGGDDDLPAPDARVLEAGVEASLDGDLSHREVSTGAGGALEGALGRRTDARTGETTTYFRLRGGLSAFADALLATGTAALEGDGIVAVTSGRSGRPRELSVLVGGHGGAGVATSGDLATAIGERGVTATTGRWEAEARVSLADPEVLAAFRAWRGAPASAGAARGLGAALRDRSRIDVRRYAREASSDSDGFGGAAGLRFAVGVDQDTEAMRLLSAATRPPGGLWERRLDCVM